MRSPSKIVAVTPAAIEIEKRAIEREKKGNSALPLTFGFSVWMLLLVMLNVQGSRFAGTNVSQKGNGLRRGDYSGIGCCGVVYD